MSSGHQGRTPPTVPAKSKDLPNPPEHPRVGSAKEPILSHPLEHRPNNKEQPDRNPGQLSNIYTSPRIVASDVSADAMSHGHPYSSHPLAPTSTTTGQDRGAPRRDPPSGLQLSTLSTISPPTAIPRSTGTTETHGNTTAEDPNGAGLIPLDSPAPSPNAREPSGMQKLFEVMRAKPTLTRTWEKRTYVEELRFAPLRPLTENGVEERGGNR